MATNGECGGEELSDEEEIPDKDDLNEDGDITDYADDYGQTQNDNSVEITDDLQDENIIKNDSDHTSDKVDSEIFAEDDSSGCFLTVL